MNVIHTLTLAQMKANPRRTLVTLAGVILSVAMLTAVFAGADSFLDLMRRQAIEDNGYWEGKRVETGEVVAQNVAKDSRVDQAALAASWGMAPLDEEQQWGASLFGVNETFYSLLNVECLEGELPASENELAISRDLARKTGWEPGDQVNLELLRVWTAQGADENGNMTYRQRSGFWQQGLHDSYVIRELGNRTFTVTAIVDPGGFDDSGVISWEPCFTVLSEQIPQDGLWSVYFTTNSHDQDIYGIMDDMEAWEAGIPSDAGGEGTPELNRMLLLYHGMDYEGSMLLPAFYGLIGVVLVIILIGAVSLARNAFSISMAERTRMLGMLASVGATKAQKRQSVLFETFVLGIVGIPLGLAAGCGGMAITLPLVSKTVQEIFLFTQPLYLSVRGLPLAAAAALAALTLVISALQPALQASRVGPMEAIRGDGNVQFHAKDLKTGRLTGKLFGFTGALALKNCKRHGGRYRSIVFSLALSVVMLLAGSGLSYYVDRAMAVRYGIDSPLASATMTFSDPALDTDQWTDSLKEISGSGGVRLVGGLQTGEMDSFSVPWENMGQEALEWIQSQSQARQENGQSALGNEESCTVYPVLMVMEDEEFYDWTGNDITLSTDCLDCVMITSTYLSGEGSYTQLKNALDIPEGFTQEFGKEGGFADTWRVAAVAEDFPYSANMVTAGAWDNMTVTLVTSRSVFQAFLERQAQAGRTGYYYWSVQYLHPENASALVDGLEEWMSNFSDDVAEGVTSTSYNSIATAGLQRFGMLLRIFCTGFVVLLCLICTANIHNTLSTGMELRSREYAMLRSVGVTPASFRRMLWLESFFYGIKALCWGLPVGIAVLALEYYAIQRTFHFAFTLPIGGILLAVGLVVIVCGGSGLLTRRRLEKDTIVESIHRTIY